MWRKIYIIRGGVIMNVSRRFFLVGAFAATVYSTLWKIDPANAKIEAASNEE